MGSTRCSGGVWAIRCIVRSVYSAFRLYLTTAREDVMKIGEMGKGLIHLLIII